MSDHTKRALDVRYSVSHRSGEGFVSFAAYRYGYVWRSLGPNGPIVDVENKSGGGYHTTPELAWAGWRRFIARLACSAKDQHKRHVATLERYRGKR